MSLTLLITERRKTDLTPLIERREPFVAPWRKRALAEKDRLGYVAVADLTRKVA